MNEIPMYELKTKDAGIIRGTIMDIEDLPTVMIVGRFSDENEAYLMPLDENTDTDCLVEVFDDENETRKSCVMFENNGVEYPIGFMTVSALNNIIQQQDELQELLSNAGRSRMVLENMVYGCNAYRPIKS